MARGQRKTVEEKIQAKQELIDALLTRVESEKRELAELLEEKKRRELETVSEMIGDYGLAPEEVAQAIQQFLDSRQAEAS
jgi:septal ring factor EnvC (AmiA/AmiB activator)